MSEDTVTIEVDGVPLTARKGQMLIEVTDANDNYVPRFCYHDKLSVAANCRMCLVEVEKAPKPLPACATPVMDGMKVFTKSKLATEAQKSVMEFLLINHPLDCPICDQGGECELQDLAMGYGSDVSRYQESKRVVKDKNIGPLVQTEMTRCIHCTRCVRFGEEIAGLRELGGTGRGEDMEIGTYVEKSMASEMSGNVIDLCPVGALTSKPFRFSARTWEMSQHDGIAAHDGAGSNLYFHVKSDQVKRVVPAENDSINEVWLSDRDRFSYEGLYSRDRLQSPMIKEQGEWKEVDWETAFHAAHKGLQSVVDTQGANRIGALLGATATSEEAYLIQKLMRALGSNNVDHRLRRSDFSDQESEPSFPYLGQSIAELEQLNAVLLVGAYPRKDQPILNHRLRKASLAGADMMLIDVVDYPFNFEVQEKLINSSGVLVNELAGVAKALLDSGSTDPELAALLSDTSANEVQRTIAGKLVSGEKSGVLLGNLATSHPQFSTIRYLAGKIAELSGATLGYLGESANSAGAALAGATPHRTVGAERNANPGLHALAMLEQKLPAYLLFNLEPELDCCDGNLAEQALLAADCVVAVTANRSDKLEQYADVLLPLAQYAENEGSYINVEGRQQDFRTIVSAPGEARPGWKILKVLADSFGLDGFAYNQLQDVGSELKEKLGEIKGNNFGAWSKPGSIAANDTLQRITLMPMNSADPLSRRASALQQTADVADGAVHINQALASSLGLNDGDSVRATQGEQQVELPVAIDDSVSAQTVLIHAAHSDSALLGPWFGDISLDKV